MAICKHERREVDFKIIYCGPSGSGKTANLSHISRKLDPHFRGEMVTRAVPGRGNLITENLWVRAAPVAGYRTTFHLHTDPGVNLPAEGREMLFRRADGVIFVADSDPRRMEANLEALHSTRLALEWNDIDPEGIPLVFQFNKRDLPGALAPDLMDALLEAAAPSCLSCATSGHRVFSTLDSLTQILLKFFHSSIVRGPEQIGEENVASSSKMALSR